MILATCRLSRSEHYGGNPTMKFAGKIIAAAALVAAGFTPAIAGEFDKQIKTRKALMQLYAWNIGQLGGMAKGAGMIHPDMATMLSLITTDAAVEAAELDALLRTAVAPPVKS